MQIRDATTADLDDVLALRARLWPDLVPDEDRVFAAAILAGRPLSTLPLVIFVAEDQGRLVGFIEVGLRSHADGCDGARAVGFIEGWYVDAEHRNRGIGRILLERAETWAAKQGCVELASDTWIDNIPSERAHLALGFEVVDRCINFRKALR